MANSQEPVPLPGPRTEWTGGPRAIGRIGRKEVHWQENKISLLNAIPGYTGRNQRMRTEGSWNDSGVRYNKNLPFATDDSYKNASPRIKTNSKNVSAFAMGDNRCRYWRTTNEDLIQLPPGYEEKAGQSIVDNWETKTPEERREFYNRSIQHVGLAGVNQMFAMVRAKIDQRTTGGPFVLRQAFKLFDKDASGDIDPDEFYGAMEFMGLQFTERQVIALFGMCDDDGGGALDYYEFIEKVLDGIACRPQSAAKRVYPKAVNVYRQQLAIGALFSQIEKKDKDATFEVDRLTIRELLDMAHTRRDGTHNEMEGHIDLVQDTIQLLAQGSISQSEFWNWWIGTTSICGIADFPVCDSYERSDFESVQSKTMDLRLKPVPPGAAPLISGFASKRKMAESATFRHYDAQPPEPPPYHSSGAMTTRYSRHRFINGHESYQRKQPEGLPRLPRLNTQLRQTIFSGRTAMTKRGGFAIASNPI